MAVRYYGAKRDTPDEKDQIKVYKHQEIPQAHVGTEDRTHSKDLSSYVDHVYNQGKLNSCTANALCAAYGQDLKKQESTLHKGYVYFDPSRLFLYYNTRYHEGTTKKDAGASIRDTVQALDREGVCEEKEWRYNIHKFKVQPSPQAYQNAQGNNLSKYERLVQNTDQLRACLNDNCPFVFGFDVYPSFHEAADKGIMPIPSQAEKLQDCHAVVAVGYSDQRKVFVVLNSWGEGWGDNGYFYMPYDVIKDPDVCFDFWKISFACQRGKPRPKDTYTHDVSAGGSGYNLRSYGSGTSSYHGSGARGSSGGGASSYSYRPRRY